MRGAPALAEFLVPRTDRKSGESHPAREHPTAASARIGTTRAGALSRGGRATPPG